MKARNLFFLLVLTVGMGSYIYWGIQKPAEEKSASSADKVIQENLDQLQSLNIFNKTSHFNLQKKNGIWWLTDRIKDLASSSKVESLTASLLRSKQKKVVLDKKDFVSRKENLKNFGFEPPVLTIEYKTSGIKKSKSLLVGNKNPSGTATYAKFSDQDRIILMSEGFASLKNAKASDYREMKLSTVNTKDLAEVSIKYKGKRIKFERDKKDNWEMTYPYHLPVDKAFTDNQLNKISLIRANEFLTKMPRALRKPDIQVVVGYKEKVHDLRSTPTDQRPNGMEIIFGRSKKKGKKSNKGDYYDYYAKSDKTEAARIAQFHYNNFTKSAEAFIKKKFDNYKRDDILSINFYEDGKLLWKLKKNNDTYSIHEVGKKESKTANKDSVEKMIRYTRNLRANTFLKPEASPSRTKLSWYIEIDLKNGQKEWLGLKKAKNKFNLWALQDGKSLKYSLGLNSFKPNLFEYKELTKPGNMGSSTHPASTSAKKRARVR